MSVVDGVWCCCIGMTIRFSDRFWNEVAGTLQGSLGDNSPVVVCRSLPEKDNLYKRFMEPYGESPTREKDRI